MAETTTTDDQTLDRNASGRDTSRAFVEESSPYHELMASIDRRDAGLVRAGVFIRQIGSTRRSHRLYGS